MNEVANRTGLEKGDAQKTVEVFFDVMKEAMQEGHNIYFRGFGSFVVKKRARKVARNIAKNTTMVIEPHYIPSFKPSRTFAEKIKNSVSDEMVSENDA